MGEEVSQVDTDIQQTAEEMNLPVEYVAEVYRQDNEAGEQTAQAAGREEKSSPPPAAAEPPAGSGIPDELAGRARQYGLDPDKFRDSQSLQDQLDAFDRMILQQNRQRSQQQAQAAQRQQQQPPAQQQQQVDPRDIFRFKLNEEEYDEDAIKSFNETMNGVYEWIAPQLQRLQQLESHVQNQLAEQHRQYEESIWSAFDGEADKLELDIFGKGRLADLSPAQQAARQSLADTAGNLAVMYQNQGRKVPDMAELVKQAARISFDSELKKKEQAELRGRLTDRSKRRASGGSHRPDKAKPFDGPAHKDPYLLGKYQEMMSEQDFI